MAQIRRLEARFVSLREGAGRADWVSPLAATSREQTFRLISGPGQREEANFHPNQPPPEPTFPPDDGWHFRHGEVWFRGICYDKLDRHQWLILQTLVSTDRPFTRGELRDAIDPKGESNQSDNGMSQKVSALRKWLQDTFNVDGDPVPPIRGFGSYQFNFKIFG
jgi:hypothetical protein